MKIVIRGNTASGVANNAPVFSPATVDRSIAENTAAGRNVGAVVTATDADNDPLGYTLGGADMASFDFDETTGQIRTKAGVSYDHEAKPSYTVTVTASDGAAGADADVTISVTDVAEPPRAPATPVVSAVAQSATSLTVTWAAPANAGRPAIDSYDMQYRASGATDWIDGPDHSTTTTVTGPVAYTLHEARVTGLTADTLYEARVRAANDEGNSGWSTPPGAGRTNTLTNNAPVFSPAIVDRSIVENIAAGEDIGAPVTATDADAGDTLTYTLGGADMASFDIVETTGQIRTKADVSYDFEAKRSYTVTVTASDGAATAAAIVTISVTDVAEPPDAPATPTVTAVTGSTTSLSVSWAAPANDGRPAIDSYDVQYRVGSSGPWTDVPQDVTGTTTTITITSLAADTSYEVRVRAVNAEGDSGWSDPPGAGRTHPLTHIAPMFSSLSQTREIAENTAAGENVGAAVTATDVNNDTLNYTLGGADAASFDIVETTGQIRTNPTSATTTRPRIPTRSRSRPRTAPPPPSPKSPSMSPTWPSRPTPPRRRRSRQCPAAPPACRSPGPPRPMRAGPPSTSYSVQWRVSGATAWRAKDVTLRPRPRPFPTSSRTRSMRYRFAPTTPKATPAFPTPWVGRTNTLTNNAPVFSSSNVARSIAENTAAGVDIGAAVTATDADAGDTLIYTLRGADAEFFDIVDTTGQIRTKDNVSYDFEARPSYTVTVRVSDGAATAEAGVTISITDVAEPPAAPATPTVSAVADSNTRLTVSWDAPANAGKPDIDSYDVQYRLSGATAWTDGPQNVTTTTTTVSGLTADTLYEVQVRATNDEGDSDWSNPPGEGRTNTATTNNAAEGAPTITGTAQVGETLTAATTGITDADGLTSPTYTYQWIRANGSEVDIAGANSSTYTLVAADLGKTIKVKVSFTDDAGTPETLTSAATATVTAAIITPVSAGLVSNLNQLATDNKLYFGSGSTKYSFAQGFTTGANPGGYTLTSIDVAFSAGVSAAAIGAVTAV